MHSNIWECFQAGRVRTFFGPGMAPTSALSNIISILNLNSFTSFLHQEHSHFLINIQSVTLFVLLSPESQPLEFYGLRQCLNRASLNKSEQQLLMCCKSKPKPVQPPATGNEPATLAKTSALPAGGPTSSSRLPRSTILFSANDYDQKSLTNPGSFIYTTKLKQGEQDRGDREEDYAIEVNQANHSRLLEPKELLTYDLDKPGGVSEISVINTFHYQTTLSHLIWGYPTTTMRNEKTYNNSTTLPVQDVRNSSFNSDSHQER